MRRKPCKSDLIRHNKMIKTGVHSFARNNKKTVIHGARALNYNMRSVPHLQRKTNDWDMWHKRPERAMDIMEDRLDQLAQCDLFYEDSSMSYKSSHTGESGKIYAVKSKLTGDSVVEFIRTPKYVNKKSYNIIKGIRWESIENAKRVYKQILADPKQKTNYKRLQKSKRDLRRITAFEKAMRR